MCCPKNRKKEDFLGSKEKTEKNISKKKKKLNLKKNEKNETKKME